MSIKDELIQVLKEMNELLPEYVEAVNAIDEETQINFFIVHKIDCVKIREQIKSIIGEYNKLKQSTPSC